ncbi:hypothetical protein PYW08_012156 [Mythimna loreyi]|uniref:Uncharacterized protein n=1 Tax=Mythimna loreyi TaxID=667449 RepID=A0ACC2Q2Z9_9NEOP|nr:hypothetical protein PYW08_012156 [Mythimna loreyi]
MSSRTSRKAAHPRAKAPEPIITRTKSAQQRKKLKEKEDKKPEKPELTKPETKSTKNVKTVKRPQESLLKVPIVIDADEFGQVEYYPNMLKRDVPAKKIMLKPKHNFKVIASTNKRKLATPQKGLKSPSSKPDPPQNSKTPRGSKKPIRTCSSPELSMQDMVRMMEETRSLSDEDFMEILTCPSPVWWEDPPDGGFDEDSIHTKLPEPPPEKTTTNKKRKIVINPLSNNSNKIVTNKQNIEQKNKTTDEKFVKKKQKLENILGNIKKKTEKVKIEEKTDNQTHRKLSESEGDFSDLSFNEEEILKNLEEMDIPIEKPAEINNIKSETDDIEIKEEKIDEKSQISSKNENVDREILSIEIKKEIKDEFLIRSPVFRGDFDNDDNIDEISSIKKSDEVVILDSHLNSSDDLNNKFSFKGKLISANTSNDVVPNKKTKDLSEFITVYKITPDKLKTESYSDKIKFESTKPIKLETMTGKLNNFFKHCKSSMRLKKIENAVPISLTDSAENEKIDLDDEKTRLKPCDYCVEKSGKVSVDFSCDKCEMAPILPCGLCNFVADTREIYKKHVSSCKDVARISWSHNYLLNQT